MSDWVERTLADACRSIDYGLTASAADKEAGPKFLRITDIVSGHIDWTTVPGVIVDSLTTEKYRLHDGDIVLARTGASTGASVYIKGPPLAVFASYLVRLQAKPEFDPRFLAYYLRSDGFWAFIRGVLGDKSAQPNASASTMTKAPFRAPRAKEEQHAIASILGALDDKIELNRRMDETLEAMARALFKSWFVDFDPVRAKTEGQDPSLPKSIADLFPDAFKNSELGEIPKGWRDTRWGTVVSLEYGKSLTDYTGNDQGYPVYGTNGKIGSCSQPLCDHPGIIIGRKGAYRGVHFCNMPFFVIDTGFYIEPKEAIELRWVYYTLLRQDINSMDSGSAIPSTSRDDFYSLPVVTPPFEIQHKFVQLLDPCWAQQDRNQKEASTLAALRDALLPKLISGELRVREAERAVAAAAG
jgi:type I restriction enzyme S subunit